jgi:inward rectifier potassium channel
VGNLWIKTMAGPDFRDSFTNFCSWNGRYSRQRAVMPRPTPKRLVRSIPIGRAEYGLLARGVPRFDLHDPYRLAISMSWPAFVATMLAIWLTINLVFGLLYVLNPGDISNARPGSLSDAFFFSIETLATVGYGVMAPATPYGHVVSAAEIGVGVSFTAILTGLLFVRFSRPRANILYADDAVVCRHGGQPAVMLRLASSQRLPLSDVQVKLFALLPRSYAGEEIREIHDLPLQQPHLPVLLMQRTLVHVIDETSPLYGLDAEALVRADARLVLTVQARDHVLRSQVYDVMDYPASRIRFGMRFGTAVTRDADGRTVFDVARLSLLEPDEGAPAAH